MTLPPEARPDREFRRAMRARYSRAFLARGPLTVLLIAILANLLFHYWAFDLISEKFEWYRSMTAIILGLSVDFFLLCLVGIAHTTFQSYADNGIIRDLRTAGVLAWDVFQPFFQMLAFLLVADTAIEGLIAAVFDNKLITFAALGYLVTLGYAIAASVFIAALILTMNLFRLPLLLQFGAALLLSFLSLLAVSRLGEFWEPMFRTWDPKTNSSAVMKLLAGMTSASWTNFADKYAYYAAMIVHGILLAFMAAPMYLFARYAARRRFPSF